MDLDIIVFGIQQYSWKVFIDMKREEKNYTTIIRTYWDTKYESRRENEFG